MASVYRRKGAKHCTIAFVNEHGERDYARGLKDKTLSRELANRIERRVERIKAGLPVEDDDRRRQPITQIMEEWLAELARQRVTDDHLNHCRRCVLRLAGVAPTLADLRADKFSRMLTELSRARGWSDRTVNDQIEKSRQFLAHCVRRGYLGTNPLLSVDKVRRPKKVRPRRAFTAEELVALENVAPDARRFVYLVAVTSGLRARELRLLEARDVDLGTPPRWRLRAEATKARRADVAPMLPECAELLTDLVRGKSPTDRVIPRVPRCEEVAADVRRSGIPNPGADGRWLNFHSLRYTFCTQLSLRLPIQRVRQLMRHATIQQTMDLYADLGVDDLWDELQALPRILP